MIENNKNSVFILFLFFGAFVECQNIGIVNGEIADIKNFPYQIAIWYRWPRYIPTSLRLHYFASGGTIIGDKWILTTAHSVEEGYDYYIRAGSSESNEGGETFEIEDIILNPDFNENDFTRRGDIAVLKLKEHITYSETMQRIVIADKYLNLYTNAKLKVSGYGQLGFLGPLEYKLRNYTAEFISMEECEGYCTYLPRDTLCLWDRKQISQSCKGDSGSPVTYQGLQIDSSKLLVGIVRDGVDCLADRLDRMTSTQYYLEWIRNTILNNTTPNVNFG